MSPGEEIAVVLDTSAISAYVFRQDRAAVGELIVEVGAEGRYVGVPAVCLAAAHAAATSPEHDALLALLMAIPAVRLLPLGAEPGGGDVRQAGELARSAYGDLAMGHAARAAMHHGAHLATTKPETAKAALEPDWSILDLGET